VFNNIIVHVEGMPGLHFPPADHDFQADGNLHWSLKDGPSYKGDPLGELRRSKLFGASRDRYAPGWEAGGLFADPKFVRFRGDWKAQNAYALRKASPAIDAGVAIPPDWPDPLRANDRGRPDIGAIPFGCEPWKVGR